MGSVSQTVSGIPKRVMESDPSHTVRHALSLHLVPTESALKVHCGETTSTNSEENPR